MAKSLRAALAVTALVALSGCYVAPVGYAYPGYYRAPVYAYGPGYGPRYYYR